ncbi:MAG: DUF3347 domain-containing protein [Sphingobacteriales bacterium]|nr:DUF3347 domain-containing protein [Sphingobacteriales bacterium]
MKHSIIGFLAIAVLALAACNNGSKTAEKKDTMNSDQMAKMDSSAATSTEKVDAPVIKASFANVSADVAAHIKEVASHYFHIKHALVGHDAAEAKKGAAMMLQVISQFDNSLLAANQKAAYTEHISAIKEHADAIIKSADINAERIHFSELSTHTYELIKAFGVGKKIYYDHCPMALDNKGANWLSESAAMVIE